MSDIKQPLRCLITGNPVGTDTWKIGYSCQCQICQTASEIERLRSELEQAREACAKVAEDQDGHFSVWGEDRNTRVAQQTCRDAAAAIRALPIYVNGKEQK